MKKLIGIFVSMLLISSIASSIPMTEVEEHIVKPIPQGKTLYVGGSGPNNYTKIQDALNDSINGMNYLSQESGLEIIDGMGHKEWDEFLVVELTVDWFRNKLEK